MNKVVNLIYLFYFAFKVLKFLKAYATCEEDYNPKILDPLTDGHIDEEIKKDVLCFLRKS